MDTLPLSEDQVAQDGAGEATPSQPAKPLVDENASTVLLNANPNGTDRAYKGFGDVTAYPTEKDVQKLRQNQNDPMMLKLFDSMYGAGSSKRYTNYPALSDVTKLLQNRDDPEFVKLFDRTYGDISKTLVPLYDPRTPDDKKQLLASHLNFVLNQGRSWADTFLGNSAVEGVESVGQGVEAAGKELARSAAEGVDYVAGTKLADEVPSSADTRLTNHPIVNSVIEGVSQFLAARLMLNGVTGGAQLGRLGTAVKEMSLGSFINAFAFNPDDPLLGDLAKHLGMGDNWFTKLDSIDSYKSELAKRGMRAGEGAVFGAALDTLAAAYRGVKAFKAGDIKAAEAAKTEVAQKVEALQSQHPEDHIGEHVDSLPAPGQPFQLQDKFGAAHDFPAKPPVEDTPLPHTYSENELFSTSREQFLKDQIEANPPIVRETKADIEGPRPPRTELPDSIRGILDNIPDFSNYSLQSIRSYVNPMLKDFLKVGEVSPLELERVMTSELHPQDVMKVQALTSMATKKAEDAAAEAGAKLDAFKKAKVTDAAEIERLSGEVKDAHDFLRDLQKLDYPLGTFAGRLLQQRQIEARLTAARRVDIGKLRSAGVSDERINEMLRTAMDTTDTTRLSELTHERRLAVAAGDMGKVADLDKLISDEMKGVEKRANSQFSSLHNQIVRDVASYTITNILSGLGTAIRNVFGIFGHVPLYRLNQMAGMIDRHGMIDGLRGYWMQAKARNLALRSGHQSYLETMASVFKDAVVDSFHGETKSHVKPMSGSTNRISAANYGMTGKPAALLNAFGRAQELLTFPLRLGDEVSSDILGRHAIGTRAAFNFFDSLQAQKELIEAKLRDPKLTAADRKTYETQLQDYKGKNPTAEIDGKRVTLKEHVEGQVQKAYDGQGRLVDPNAIDETNYILLRNRQTPSAFGQAIEKAVNSTPYIRFLVPVFNAPMNGFKRGFENVPVLRHMLTDLDAELKSSDPYIRSMARGKLNVGWGMIGTAMLLADQGLISVEPTNSRAPRLSAQASSSPGPFQLKIAGTNWDLSGLDPVSVPLVWAAVFNDSLKKYIAAADQNVAIQDQKGEPVPIMQQRLERLLDIGLAIGGATGQAIMQNPAVSGMKDVVDLLVSIGKMSDDDQSVGKEATKLVRGQLGKLIPNAYKQMLGLFDSKRYDPSTVMDVLNAAAGDNRKTPMLYDIMGRPMENKSPTRSLLGPLAAVRPPDKDSKAQYVIDTLDNWGEITGHYYTFQTNPPDPVLKRYGIDLRTVDSLVGNRKVQDEFASNYRDLQIRGQTIDEALYTVVTHAVKNGMPVGNKLERNPDVWGAIDKTVNEYKSLAWEVTLRKEFEKKNSPLFKQINSAYAMKYAAQDPAFDRPDTQGIQERTREMLRTFPQ